MSCVIKGGNPRWSSFLLSSYRIVSAFSYQKPNVLKFGTFYADILYYTELCWGKHFQGIHFEDPEVGLDIGLWGSEVMENCRSVVSDGLL